MPQTSAVPDRSTAGLTDASPAEPRLPDAGPLDPEAFRYIATTPVRIGRTSRPILQRAGISAGGLNTFLRSLRTLVTHATDAVVGFRRRPADVWTEIQFNRTTFYRYLRCAITAGSAATEPAGTRGVVLFTFPRAGGTLRDEQSRSAGRFVTSSPAQRDASPGGTVVVKSEIKESEIRTRSTTTTDHTPIAADANARNSTRNRHRMNTESTMARVRHGINHEEDRGPPGQRRRRRGAS